MRIRLPVIILFQASTPETVMTVVQGRRGTGACQRTQPEVH